jgi:formylglycine-generating enzyme required for sulfatase activity
MDELRPVKEKLFDPLVAEFRNRATERTAERTLAMSILADYASDQADAVADLVMEADEKQFPVLFPKLASYREAAISRFGEELAKPIPVSVNGEDRDAFAKRQANAAIGLILLDRPEKAWPLLRQSPDPSVRSYLIHRANPLGVPPSTIVERLAAEQDVSARRALLLILAELGADRLPPVQREAVVHSALEMYHGDPDPGIHGAAASLLAGWTQRRPLADIKGKLASGQAEGSRRWYVNGEGQTLAVIPGPTEFVAGSPPTEDGREGGEEGTSESQHRARIDRSFAIGMTEVTVEQFLRHRKDHPYNKQYAPTSDCPINCISWYDAAAYCNWLSQREGITTDQLCYLPNAAGKYSEGMKIARDYLGRTGYRLPTEAEWEFACRAGAATSRYFGDTEELLDEYAWHVRRSKDRRTLPVASLKPNDFGLFDMLGNAWEWCADRYAPDATALESQDQLQDPRDNEGRVLRGGSLYRVLSLRSADRDKEQPANRDNYIGFRVARTIGYAGASTALGTKESRK